MIQILLATAFVLGGGALFEDCFGKKKSNPEKSENGGDNYSFTPKTPGDLSWANSRLKNYCKQFSDINLQAICAPRKSDNQQASHCIRNPTPEKIVAIAQGWNDLGEYDRMTKAACFALQAEDDKGGYQILATALNNGIDHPNKEQLADSLAASEKAMSFSPNDSRFKKLTATMNGLMGVQLINDQQPSQAYPFFQRAASLYETLPSNKYGSAEDLNLRLQYYNFLIIIKLKTDNFSETKKYFESAFALLSLRSSEIMIDMDLLDQFVELFHEALTKDPPPLIVNEKEANWETIGRAYYQLAKSEQDCKKAEAIMLKARKAFTLAGKEKQYNNLTKSTCNPHN